MEIPSPEKFFFESPLYEVFDYAKEGDDKLLDIVCFKGKVDAYCPGCIKETTYKRKGEDQLLPRYKAAMAIKHSTPLMVTLCCSRDEKHEVEIFIKNDSDKQEFLKIGQLPSLATLMKGEVGKYRKVLGNKFEEFARGIGLASHGIGIGSFVYLRRIFESLVEEAHLIAQNEKGWVEADYKGRMDEKIKLLHNQLPPLLVKNKSLYGIVSKGIHELTEEECLDAFLAVKLGIEIILDEKIKQKEQEAKEKLVTALIQKTAEKLKA